MKRTLFALIALFLFALPQAAEAYRFQPQKNLTTTWSTPADASTDCTASETDYSPVFADTDALTCFVTEEFDVRGFDQMTVQLDYVNSTGTAVKMQCDQSNDGGVKWTPIMNETAAGEKSVRTWTETTSVNARITHNWQVNAWLVRCRLFVTAGGAGDTISYFVRIASQVGEKN